MALACPPGAAAGAEPLEWHFSQVFGERSPGEEVQEGELMLPFFLPHLQRQPIQPPQRWWHITRWWLAACIRWQACHCRAVHRLCTLRPGLSRQAGLPCTLLPGVMHARKPLSPLQLTSFQQWSLITRATF
jgi:hypothetical protein